VVANVHNQVSLALKKYGKRVQGGALTVVGAVFDFRNDLGQGAGKFMIVDVNGNGEPERMEAFMAAINEGPRAKNGKKSPREALAPEDAIRSLEQVKGIITREVASASNDSPHGHGD
jgi:hypothetical protein